MIKFLFLRHHLNKYTEKINTMCENLSENLRFNSDAENIVDFGEKHSIFIIALMPCFVFYRKVWAKDLSSWKTYIGF